jgi:hypothetical protein
MCQKPAFVCIAVAFLFFVAGSYAQDDVTANGSFNKVLTIANEKYGIQQQLANGVYFEDTYRGAKGHPYLLLDQFSKGDVTFYGKEYKDVPLKYDLFGQQLLINHPECELVFTNVLAKEFTDEFSLHGLDFRKMTLLDHEAGFFQVVAEEDDVQCYYGWYRIRHESIGGNDNRLYSFTGDKQRRYLVVKQVVRRYSNNLTFTRIFEQPLRGTIRLYLRQHDLKIQKATDKQVAEVIRFIAAHIHQPDNT